MRVFKKLTWSILFASCVLVFAACSDDDNEEPTTDPVINPSTVFTGGFPKSVADMSMTYTNGLLKKIRTDDGKEIIFDYGIQLKSDNQLRSSVAVNGTTMTRYDEDNNIEYYFYDMKFNNNGFIVSCKQDVYDEYDGKSIETWEFGYNSDNQLNYMKRSEGGNEVTSIKYENGNITEVSMLSEEDDDKLDTRIFYTSDDAQTAINNKCCLMLFDITFGIDMDEMKYAYWAGLLGKATKNLPVKITYIEDSEEEETETFQWTIKDDYVQKMIQITSWGTEEHLFTWE